MKDLITSLILLCILVLVVNPMHFWMPSSAHMATLGTLVAVFGLLAVFVLREQAADEREQSHRALAGRMAFLVGAAILITGIVLQGIEGTVDAWLAAALAGMVLAKVGVRAYSDRNL